MIDSFKGEYRWLSNFWPARVSFEGIEYDCVEKAYVAAKFDLDAIAVVKTAFGDAPVHLRSHVRNLESAGKAKRFGRKYANKMTSDWNDSYKLGVMTALIQQKFSEKNPLLVQKLLATGDQKIIEGNTWGDTFWGVRTGSSWGTKQVGEGENHLGKILMARRSYLRSAEILLDWPENDGGTGIL